MEILNPPNQNSSAGTIPAKINFSFVFLVSILPFLSSTVLAKPVDKKYANKAWSIVQEALTTEDSVIRETAVQGLQYVDNNEVINALTSSLKDESEYVQIWAARSLARKGNPAGKNVLVGILKKSVDVDKSASGPLAALQK